MVKSLEPCEMRLMICAVLTRQPCRPACYTGGISSFASHSLKWFAFVEFNYNVYGPSQILAVSFKKNKIALRVIYCSCQRQLEKIYAKIVNNYLLFDSGNCKTEVARHVHWMVLRRFRYRNYFIRQVFNWTGWAGSSSKIKRGQRGSKN
jgi:hypothetical protein